jgi:NADPH:quinone reductase-like Zn-dependent oxidoreductase
MKAVIVTKYGGPEALAVMDAEIPSPKEGEILVRVMAALVVATDPVFRAGKPLMARLFSGLAKPKKPVPGDALSGVVEAVGAGVTAFKPGDAVVCALGDELGAHAEYAIVKTDAAAIKKPEGLGFAEAAALCDGPLGALHFLRDCCGLEAGKRVLVIGASGAVGCAAVQLCKLAGAEVTGVSSGANEGLVRSLGADSFIDYSKEDFKRNGKAYDIILDAVTKSSFKACRASLSEGGVYQATVPTIGYILGAMIKKKAKGKRYVFGAPGLRPAADKKRDLAWLAALAAGGELKLPIDRRFGLGEIAEAHRYVEAGHKKGNVILEIADGGVG